MNEASLSLNAASTVRLTDSVYLVLKKNILNQTLQPGQRLHLDQLTEQLGVSLTPIKEALNRLANDGLVEIVPRRGTYVTNPGPEEISEAFDVRCALEVYAVRLTLTRASEEELHRLEDFVNRLDSLLDSPDRNAIYQQFVETDRRFHRCIVELSHNSRLLRAFDREHTHMYMARIRYGRSEEGLDEAQQEHRGILEAFLARDIALAQERLTCHIERARQSLLNELQS